MLREIYASEYRGSPARDRGVCGRISLYSIQNDPGSRIVSQVLAVAGYMGEVFFGDDLRFPHCHNRLAGRWPDEPPGARRDGPESLTGVDVDQGKRVVAVLGASRHQEPGSGGGLFRGRADAPTLHDLVAVVAVDIAKWHPLGIFAGPGESATENGGRLPTV